MDLTLWEQIRTKLTNPRMGKYAVVGLAALLVLVAVFAGKSIIDAATAKPFELSKSSEEPTLSQAESQGAGQVYVHVSGSVKKPGLVTLDQGARVAQAIEAAGGFAKDAALDSVNLARVVNDGEQVYVSQKQDETDGAAQAPVAGRVEGQGEARSQAQVQSQAQAQANAQGGLVNINSAGASELEELPGIGPSTAQKIIADRTSNGPFASVQDLSRVSGIGDKKLAVIIDLICV